MVNSPSVSTDEALSLLREDLKILESGFLWASPFLNRTLEVRGVISWFVADLPQHSESLRHGGNKSHMNCANCLTTINDRL